MRTKLILVLSCLLESSLKTECIYTFIKKVPFDSHGWFNKKNQEMLKIIIAEKKPKIVIEIGSWLGASTRLIAQTISDESIVYAIDTWKGSNEPAHLNDPRVKDNRLFHIFLSNVIQTNLQNKIIPIRMTSMEAYAAFDGYADLIYIDGSHLEEDVYMDITKWYEKLALNGVICGDDWQSWPSVTKAVERAARTLKKIIKSHGTFWYFN